jgi:hypothetical protein
MHEKILVGSSSQQTRSLDLLIYRGTVNKHLATVENLAISFNGARARHHLARQR